MEIRRLTTPMLGANTYLLSEEGRALVVDPHAGEEGRCFLRQHAATHPVRNERVWRTTRTPCLLHDRGF